MIAAGVAPLHDGWQPLVPGKGSGDCQETWRPYRRSGGHCQFSRSAAVVRWRRIDPDSLRLTPAASAAAPAAGMPLASLLVDASTLLADGICLASMALIGCHEPDAAVAVLVVVAIHKCRHPSAGLLDALEWPAGVVGRYSPLRGTASTQCGTAIPSRGCAHPRPGEGSEHTQLLQAAFQRGGTGVVAVVGMEDQRLGATLADPLPQAGPADETSGDLGLLPLGHGDGPDPGHAGPGKSCALSRRRSFFRRSCIGPDQQGSARSAPGATPRIPAGCR